MMPMSFAQTLSHVSVRQSLRDTSMMPMSFAQTLSHGHVPTWDEENKMLHEERSSLEAFSRRNEEQIEALKEHKPVMSVLQMGMDTNEGMGMVPSSFLEAPADAGEKTRKAVE